MPTQENDPGSIHFEKFFVDNERRDWLNVNYIARVVDERGIEARFDTCWIFQGAKNKLKSIRLQIYSCASRYIVDEEIITQSSNLIARTILSGEDHEIFALLKERILQQLNPPTKDDHE